MLENSNRFEKSIVKKISIALILPIGFLSIVFAAAFTLFQYRYLKSELILKGERYAGIFAAAFSGFPRQSQEEILEKLMEIASRDNEIAGISIEGAIPAYRPNRNFSVTETLLVEKEVFDRENARSTGKVAIYLSLSETRAKTLKAAIFIVSFFLFLTLMLLAINRNRLKKLVVDPVNGLSDFAMDFFKSNEPPKIAISGDDEIGRLAHSFDAFAERAYERLYLLNEAIDEKNEMLTLAKTELKRQTRFDDLTGLCNRMEFDRQTSNEWTRMQRAGRPISLILCDIDEYEKLKNRFDAMACDDCLKEIAAVVRQCCRRPADLPARFGEKTFAALLPETDSQGARTVAESIRTALTQAAAPRQKAPEDEPATLSFGIGTIVPGTGAEYNYLVALADSALFESKQKGGGRITTNAADQSCGSDTH